MDILETLRLCDEPLSSEELERFIRKHNQNIKRNEDHFSKKKVLAFYRKTKANDPDRWASWSIDPALEDRLERTLRLKPRRTASGVATVTVMAKPWPCSSNCLYCPNDLKMPKSYLSDEPVCQRAERSWFDPYLQMTSRIRALTDMGHVTDKVEVIILGGTWCDYPQEYQTWFVCELFRALNDGDAAEAHAKERRAWYRSTGLSNDRDRLKSIAAPLQEQVNDGRLTFNQAFHKLYDENPAWQRIASMQKASMEELERQHRINENAAHRVVGLVVETRPDTITPESLRLIRRMGATKIQMGIQSLDGDILRNNLRVSSATDTRHAFELVRLYGFKIHAHIMVNLYGSSPEQDKHEYLAFTQDEAYKPDEVKLYPCMLVDGTGLKKHYLNGSWAPYSDEELLDVLVQDTLATPPYTRISRMIRDISAHDIMAGNKHGNLRQLVEQMAAKTGEPVHEIRYREINNADMDDDTVHLEDVAYTTSVSDEHFLQWVTPSGAIAGFLRLSLPHAEYVQEHADELAVLPGEAMIREVHVYGKVSGIGTAGTAAQHRGLGKKLVARACDIASDAGFSAINVISAVGTREYYRKQGFSDNGLYFTKAL
ncbi:elongator complex protein 3 [Slackia heliotrinireducens]|uniref:elongator complex protein 3 n=1 Tax=Slackia heliotrinireducens TaxID=84110 RepID=UPI0033157754